MADRFHKAASWLSTMSLSAAASTCVLFAAPSANADSASRFEIRPVAKNGAGLSDAGGNMAFSKASYPRFFASSAAAPSKQVLQSPDLISADQTAQSAALVKAAEGLDCSKPNPAQGDEDPKLPLVACSSDGNTKYVLMPAIIDASQVSCTDATPTAMGLVFSPEAQKAWAKRTGSLTAAVLNSKVLTASAANAPTQLTWTFFQQDAAQLVDALGGCRG